MTTTTAPARETKETRAATWLAINGHKMEGTEYRFVSPEGAPGRWRTEGWSARHSGTCTCTGWFGGDEDSDY